LVRIAALHAEALDELLVHFRHHRFGNLGDLEVDLDLAAGQLGHAPVGREIDRDVLFLAL
jgi:hypothetical protein